MVEGTPKQIDFEGGERERLDKALRRIAVWSLLVSVGEAPFKEIPFVVAIEAQTPSGEVEVFDLTLSIGRSRVNEHRGADAVFITAKQHGFGKAETGPFLMNVDAEIKDPAPPSTSVECDVSVFVDGGFINDLGGDSSLVTIVEILADALNNPSIQYDPDTQKRDMVRVSL